MLGLRRFVRVAEVWKDGGGMLVSQRFDRLCERRGVVCGWRGGAPGGCGRGGECGG